MCCVSELTGVLDTLFVLFYVWTGVFRQMLTSCCYVRSFVCISNPVVLLEALCSVLFHLRVRNKNYKIPEVCLLTG